MGIAWSILSSSLDVYREEHEAAWAEPETVEERNAVVAMRSFDRFGLDVLQTGQISPELEAELASFKPGDSIGTKLDELLSHEFVKEQLEFNAASEVVDRLIDLPRRIVVSSFALTLLRDANPSMTAVKYLQRASASYLAGFTTEVVIMCGAVIEAALAERVPDSLMENAKVKKQFVRKRLFTPGQRLRVALEQGFLSRAQFDMTLSVLEARNNAVHVQPDIGPKPDNMILRTAVMLGAILPAIDG